MTTAFRAPVEPTNINLIKSTDFSSVFRVKDANDFFTQFNKNGSTSLSTLTTWCEEIDVTDNTMRSYLEECMRQQVPASFDGYNAYVKAAIESNEQLSLSTKASKIALEGFALAGCMLAMIVISELITGLYKLAQVSKDVAESAQEIGSSFKSTEKDLDSYKEKVEELQETIDDSCSSIAEVTDARKELLTIQSEMIDKYGTEQKSIDAITDAINNETNAWERLTEAKWREAKNEFTKKGFINDLDNFLHGYDDNIERMEEEYGNYEANISLGYISSVAKREQAEKILGSFGQLRKDENDVGRIIISGNATEVYDKLLEIQDLVDDSGIEFDNTFTNELKDLANAAKEVSDKYKDFFNQWVLNEKILNSKNGYADVYKGLIDAYEAYQDVVNSDDAELAENKKNTLINSITEEMDKAIAKGDTDVASYFRSMYPELQDEIDTWNFDLKFKANTDELKTSVTDALSKLGGLSKEQLLQFDMEAATDEQKEGWSELKSIAKEYSLTTDELINRLEALEIIRSENYNKLVNKFDEEHVKRLSPEALQIAYKVSNATITSWDQLIKRIKEYKAEQKDTISFNAALSQVQNLSKGFDQLDSIYADVSDKDYFDWSSILNNDDFKETFAECGDVYDDFIKTVSNAPSDLSTCQSAFDDLATAYITQSGILEDVTEETANSTATMLKQMGVANAVEVVTSALEKNTEAKKLSALAGIDLVNATANEIYALEGLETEFANAGEAAFIYYLNKRLDSDVALNTVADCEALIALAGQCKVTGKYIELLTKLKQNYDIYNSDIWGDATKQLALDNITKYTNKIRNLTPADISIPTIKFTGGEKSAKSASDSAKDAKDAKDSAKDWFDFMERRIEVLTDAFENLEKGMENVMGAGAKNRLVDAQIGIYTEEINNYTDALAMYKKMADDALGAISNDELRKKIKDGAVDLTSIEGSNADTIKSSLDEYTKWANKVSECTQQLEELKTQIRELELQKFNNLVEDFTNQFDILEDSLDLINGQIGLLEEAGELIGSNYYTKQIEQSEKQLAILESQKNAMVQQMTDAINSGRIQKGTEEWLEMQNALTEVETSILDCKTSIEEFNNELLELNWQIFERVQTEFDNLNTEMETLVGLFDEFNEIEVSDGKGTWTNEAIATLGIYAQQLELSRYQVDQYTKAIEDLDKEYAEGKYSATEYMDKLAELKQGQYDAVESSKSLEDAIIDLNETRVNEEIDTINEEIDAYKELIDAQIELIEETEKLREKQEDLAEKSKSVADIERQLAAMANDNSAATVAKRKQLEEQLAEAKKDLSDAEHDYSVESQKDALNKQYEDYEKARNDEIEALEESLKNREQLISDSLAVVKQNTDVIGAEIAMIAQRNDIIVSDALISAWAQGETAIAGYGEVLSAQSSVFISNVMGIENEIYALQDKANEASVSLSNMFSNRADVLVNELTSSYNSIDNLNNMTNILQNSLINTLERGYNVGSLVDGLNDVASAANAAANAVAGMVNSFNSGTSGGTSIETSIGRGGNKYNVKEIGTGKVLQTFDDYDSAYKYWKNNKASYQTARYAKGGIVSKKDGGVLDPIARSLGEDRMVAVRDGEGILTPSQTEAFVKMAQNIDLYDYMPKYEPQIKIPETTPVAQNVSLHYDKMFEFNGDFNNSEELLAAMKKVAKNTTTKILDDINRDYKMRH